MPLAETCAGGDGEPKSLPRPQDGVEDEIDDSSSVPVPRLVLKELSYLDRRRHSQEALILKDGKSQTTVRNPEFPLWIGYRATGGNAQITANLSLYYCKTAAESLCYFKDVQLILPITVSPDGSSTAEIKHALAANP